ncbi:RNA polymerase sigma factor [Luteitalea pratensis]|uniref:RNA polymerase sigma factor n=1 Tax=Luteitalea pratensis TaxID=1855912 RepID=A0A143PHC7_LUTPR|nr:ECF-type sigma factor [Luteitalea pratensis]AMY07935.1 RNA polymerase sigma factor [Luteitalea pratensis]
MMTDTPAAADITGRLARWRHGDDEARNQLFALVQPQLRHLAARLLHRERRDHTLEPNAVVNELCLRLIGSEPLSYQDRAHFFAVAAQTMRRILIDHARARVAGKRGGKQRRVALSDLEGWGTLPPSDELLDLDTLLSELETADRRAATVVELRFFGGMQEEEIAEALSVSVITVKRDWKAARAWLAARLQ